MERTCESAALSSSTIGRDTSLPFNCPSASSVIGCWRLMLLSVLAPLPGPSRTAAREVAAEPYLVTEARFLLLVCL